MLLYSVYGGSRLYNLQGPNSDQDIRGVFIEPPNIFFSLETMDYYEDIPTDTVMYSLRKFIHLALKNNPNTLELLFAPPYKWITHAVEWREIYTFRHKFLSERAIKAYKGFILSEYDKIRASFGYMPDDTPKFYKRLSHVYRLTYNLAQLMSIQTIIPNLSGHERYTALGIKSGAISFNMAYNYIDDLLFFINERPRTNLPEEPDYDYINARITDIQRRVITHDYL